MLNYILEQGELFLSKQLLLALYSLCLLAFCRHLTQHFVNIQLWASMSFLPKPMAQWQRERKGYAVFRKCALAACCVCVFMCVCVRKAAMTLTIWAVDRRKVYVVSLCFEMVVYPELCRRQTRDSVGSYLGLPQAAGCPCNAVFLKLWATRLSQPEIFVGHHLAVLFSSHAPPHLGFWCPAVTTFTWHSTKPNYCLSLILTGQPKCK